MKFGDTLNNVLTEIRVRGRLPVGIPVSQLQTQLLQCKIVMEQVLNEKYKGVYFKIDVSEYFNLIIIRVATVDDGLDTEANYTQLCKDFKDLFTECGIRINVAIFLGNIEKDDYFYSITY